MVRQSQNLLLLCVTVFFFVFLFTITHKGKNRIRKGYLYASCILHDVYQRNTLKSTTRAIMTKANFFTCVCLKLLMQFLGQKNSDQIDSNCQVRFFSVGQIMEFMQTHSRQENKVKTRL